LCSLLLSLFWGGRSVNRSGLVHPPDARGYAEFGDWIRAQYGPPPHFNSEAVGALHNQTVLGNASYDRPTSQLVADMRRSGGKKTTKIDRAMIVSTTG
jgi:hypothetical protein